MYQVKREAREIGGVFVENLDSRYDVRFHAAHDMNLNPFAPEAFATMFMVEPLLEAACAEARGIRRKILLNGFQWCCRLFNHGREDRPQLWIFKIVQDGIEVRHAFNKAHLFRFPKITKIEAEVIKDRGELIDVCNEEEFSRALREKREPHGIGFRRDKVLDFGHDSRRRTRKILEKS